MNDDYTVQSFIAGKYSTDLYDIQELTRKLVFNGLICLPQDDYNLSLNSITYQIRQSTTPET